MLTVESPTCMHGISRRAAAVPAAQLILHSAQQAPEAASSQTGDEGGDWESWAPADEKWRELLKNDPFAKSAMGRDI